MAYDPRRDRPGRPSDVNGASAVDTLLDGGVADRPHSARAPSPDSGNGQAPEPPEAWSERLLYSVGISTVLGAVAALVALRLLWKLLKRLRS